MDNQAPGLNFSVAAIIGLSELDVDNIELLSGASSALYGPGGMNGTLLMTSKNPFKYQGLSFLVKEGIMHTDKRQRDASAYHNWNVRWAKKISEKFAFKINMELIQAKDWQGTDYRNYARAATNGAVKAGDRSTDPNYDGINDYFNIFPNRGAKTIKKLLVFNRWGACVYEGSNLRPGNDGEGWDGTFKGKECNPDVYVYYSEVEFLNGRIQIVKGSITLVR